MYQDPSQAPEPTDEQDAAASEAGETEQADSDVTPNTGDDDAETAPQAPAESGWAAD